MNSPHIPVLKDEVLDVFKEIKDGVIVDCTVGFGGHSEALLKANENIKMICIDQDDEALEFSKKRLEKFKDRVIFKKGRFSKIIKDILREYDNVKGVLADIGVSSLQLDKKERGFGFFANNLDMRMDQNHTALTAYDVVNYYPKEKLEKIFKEYGEIKNYKKMASLIDEHRKKKPFSSAKELAEFLKKHFFHPKLHPATLAFQAIRIEVNQELEELKNLLENLKILNNSKLLVAIITFHSLEDKIVKNTFKEWSKKCICPPHLLKCECGGNNSLGEILTKKPIVATRKEIDKNPRSRSSKLRVFRFC